MKYDYNGIFEDIYVKSYDTLPVGTEVDFDGDSVPSGWTAINGYEEVTATDYVSFNNSVTINNVKAYKCGSIVFVNFDIATTINNGETVLGTCTNKLITSFYGIGRVARWDGATLQAIGPATFIAISNGALRAYTSMNGTASSGTLILIVND